METLESNTMKTNSMKKPWEDEHGLPLPDGKLREVSRTWTKEIWKDYAKTLEGAQRELLSPKFEKILMKHDARSQSLAWGSEEPTVGKERDDRLTRVVKKALKKLTFQQRRVIEATYYRGLTARQISQWLGMSEKNVEALLKRAKGRLRTILVSGEDSHLPMSSQQNPYKECSGSARLGFFLDGKV